jgi:hypothetical protein
MATMKRSAATSSVSPPRRFILLPEETVDGSTPGRRIRRYRLTSVGGGAGRRREGMSGAEAAPVRIGRALGGRGRV